ncbi:MAG: DUF167 domain-containing protein [Acidimicrobiales bacterium]
MRILVKVKPRSRTDEVNELPNGYEVKVTAPAEDGKANKRVIELLADHFKVAKSAVVIRSGHTSRTKIVEIEAAEDGGRAGAVHSG